MLPCKIKIELRNSTLTRLVVTKRRIERHQVQRRILKSIWHLLYHRLLKRMKSNENDECYLCLSSKRLRTSYNLSSDNNNNNDPVSVTYNLENKCPIRLQQLIDMPYFSYKTQLAHGWNPLDSSFNINLKNMDPLSLHRHPVAQSTDAIRGKMGFSRGFHMWRIDWKSKERGTHAVVGICTKEAPLHCHGYCCLIGLTEDSWGWDVVKRRLVHKQSDENDGPIYPSASYNGYCENNKEEVFEVPDSIYVLLDLEDGSLSFVVDGRYLGVAFNGLKGKTLYPAVSAVWGHCEVSMVHLVSLEPPPLNLLQLCRFYIRKQLRVTFPGNLLQTDDAVNYDLTIKIESLNIPEYLKVYLKNGSFQI